MYNTDFQHKVVVITGAAGGIGSALASQFARCGAKIALLDIDEAQLLRTEHQLYRYSVEENILAMHCDITDPQQCQLAASKIAQSFGGVDILINNAGVTHHSALTNTDTQIARQIMEINFFGALHCTKAFMEQLVEHKGMIINISSTAGIAPMRGRSAYCASKYAMHGLFESLRLELQDQGVRVMMVCPGFTRTKLHEKALVNDGSTIENTLSLSRHGVSAYTVARKTVRGAAAGRQLLVITDMGSVFRLASRVFPRLVGRFLMKRQEK